MPEFPDRIETEHLFDARIDLEAPEQVGAGPMGRRSIFIVKSGEFAGPRLRGTVRPGGGDWLLSFAGGYNELDVRGTLETHDGALLYLSYRGVLLLTPEQGRRSAAGETLSPREYYFRTTPRFETGDERYAWLNSTVCVGHGAFGPNEVSYRVFAVK